MPGKIIHTADVHLDAIFASLPPAKAGQKREAIRRTFRSTVEDCLAWGAEVLVVAGDLFDGERVSPDTVGFLKGLFERLSPIPVVIAPGNHDAYTTSSSPYCTEEWGQNVHIFTSGRTAVLEFDEIGLSVAGVAHTSRHMPGRLIERVEPAAATGASLLVVHASRAAGAGEKSGEDMWLEFTDKELVSLGYDYVALGHYHGSHVIVVDDRVCAAYPGSPEGLGFSETGRQGHLRVTLGDNGAQVEAVSVSHIDYAEIAVACDEFESRQQFFDALEAMVVTEARRKIARFVATGRTAPGFSLAARLPDEIAERFFHASLVDRTAAGYDWDEIEAEKSLRAEVARRFAEALAGADGDERLVLETARIYAIETLDGITPELSPEVLDVD